MLYIGVTGSRELRDRDLVLSALREHSMNRQAFLVVGDQHSVDPLTGETYGADWIAHDLWTLPSNPNWRNAKVFAADWNRYSKRAGMIRNTEMVRWVLDTASPKIWLAFYQRGAENKGTAHCANYARKHGIEVREHWAA